MCLLLVQFPPRPRFCLGHLFVNFRKNCRANFHWESWSESKMIALLTGIKQKRRRRRNGNGIKDRAWLGIDVWLVIDLYHFFLVSNGKSLLWENLCPCKKLLSNFGIISTTVTSNICFFTKILIFKPKINWWIIVVVRQLRIKIENCFSRSTVELSYWNYFIIEYFISYIVIFSFFFISLFYLYVYNKL